MNIVPNERVVFTIIQLGPDTRLVGDAMLVTNPGTAFEQRTSINQTDVAKQMNQTLQTALPAEVAALQHSQTATTH